MSAAGKKIEDVWRDDEVEGRVDGRSSRKLVRLGRLAVGGQTRAALRASGKGGYGENRVAAGLD